MAEQITVLDQMREILEDDRKIAKALHIKLVEAIALKTQYETMCIHGHIDQLPGVTHG